MKLLAGFLVLLSARNVDQHKPDMLLQAAAVWAGLQTRLAGTQDGSRFWAT